MSNFEWKIMWKKGLRGGEGRKREKLREKCDKTRRNRPKRAKTEHAEIRSGGEKGQTFNAKPQSREAAKGNAMTANEWKVDRG
jgi:hypothetical protein